MNSLGEQIAGVWIGLDLFNDDTRPSIAGVFLGCARVHSTCGAPQVVKTGNPSGSIMFAMLIKVIVISKMQMFCGLNQNNDPVGYLLLHVDEK